MSIATDLLKAPHIGIRDLKEHLSMEALRELLVITDRGTPVSVNIPYADVLELADIFDELSDLDTLSTIKEAREAIRAGGKGVCVSKLFNKIRRAR